MEPQTVYDAAFSPSRLRTLRTRNSAAYKGIYALLMGDNTQDWLTATKIDFSSYFSEAIDIHHIFPVKWCTSNGIDRQEYDCIVNKTPLTGRTNRFVGGDSPSRYLKRLRKHADVPAEGFDKMLRSHVLDPVGLYSDDFSSFFEDRKERILQRIENAMGKRIPRDSMAYEEEGVFVGNRDEDTDEIAA